MLNFNPGLNAMGSLSSCGNKKTRNDFIAELKKGRRDFTEADLSGLNLSGLDLSHCDFSNANMTKVRIENTNIDDTNFVQTNLQNAEWIGVQGKRSVMDKANMGGMTVNLSEFTGGSFSYVSARGATLRDSQFHDVLFQGSDFSNATIVGSRFSDIQAQYASFESAHIDDCTWEIVLFTLALFDRAEIKKSRLNFVVFRGASFKWTRIRSSALTSPDLSQCDWSNIGWDNSQLIDTDLFPLQTWLPDAFKNKNDRYYKEYSIEIIQRDCEAWKNILGYKHYRDTTINRGPSSWFPIMGLKCYLKLADEKLHPLTKISIQRFLPKTYNSYKELFCVENFGLAPPKVCEFTFSRLLEFAALQVKYKDGPYINWSDKDIYPQYNLECIQNECLKIISTYLEKDVEDENDKIISTSIENECKKIESCYVKDSVSKFLNHQ
jgi:uncharacterized protein YjbI with pentapeptide repeats